MATLLGSLRDAGYVDGQNIDVEARWADGRYDQLPALVAELKNSRAAVILAGRLPAALTAKAATSITPIVFVTGADPVKQGLVASMNRPGGNVTGVLLDSARSAPSQLKSSTSWRQRAATLGVLTNSSNPNTESHLGQIRSAARPLGQDILVVDAGTGPEIETAFAALRERHPRAFLVADDPLFAAERDRLVAEALRPGVATMFFSCDFAAHGGLAAYAPSSPRCAD